MFKRLHKLERRLDIQLRLIHREPRRRHSCHLDIRHAIWQMSEGYLMGQRCGHELGGLVWLPISFSSIISRRGQRPSTCSLCGGTHRGRHGDEADIGGVGGAFYTIAYRKERVEALYKGRVTMEEGRDTLDHSGCIDSTHCQQLKHAHCRRGSYIWLLKSFMMSRKWLYTSGRSIN
jgi:hypothetical protein